MTARPSRTVRVDLGPFADKAEERVKSGAYPSVDEVVREGLRALEREEAMLDSIVPPSDVDESDPAFKARLKAAVEEALADPRPPIGGEEVRRRLYERHEARLKRGG